MHAQLVEKHHFDIGYYHNTIMVPHHTCVVPATTTYNSLSLHNEQ